MYSLTVSLFIVTVHLKSTVKHGSTKPVYNDLKLITKWLFESQSFIIRQIINTSGFKKSNIIVLKIWLLLILSDCFKKCMLLLYPG